MSKNQEENKDLEDLMAELAETREKLAVAEKRAEENLAGWQRAKADYLNNQKESEKRGRELFEYANAAFMAEILPVYSYFKLAMSHVPEDQKNLDWVKGVAQIQKQFQDFLGKYEIKEISTVGEKFDHNKHEAIAHEEKEGFEIDVIFEEVQPGYLLGDKVLMPAKVKVAK